MTGPIHSISAKERGFMMRNTASAHRFWGRMCLCLLAFCCLLAAGAPAAGALSYQYDRKDKAVPAPDGYACVRQARSDQAEKGANWDPNRFVHRRGRAYQRPGFGHGADPRL